MPALFERAIGADWTSLHRRLRDRYGLVADDDQLAVGRGRMRELRRSALAVPVLLLATADDFLFPEDGTDVPFTSTTTAFEDANGYEGLVFRRDFGTDPPRTFLDALRYNHDRNCITDIFGRRGHVAADLHVGVEEGDLTLELGTQWLRVGGRYVRFPSPLAARGSLREWYDETTGNVRVTASIRGPLVGELVGYAGQFDHEFHDADAADADAPHPDLGSNRGHIDDVVARARSLPLPGVSR